jgi:hypothetical protein
MSIGTPVTGCGISAGGFGVLLLYALASVAVIAFFARNPGPGQETTWAHLIAPALASPRSATYNQRDAHSPAVISSPNSGVFAATRYLHMATGAG